MSIFRKEKRTIYLRKVKNFWEEYSHNKIGLLGILILILYLFVAVFTPYVSPSRPATQEYWPPRVATSFAKPEWIRISPQFQDLAPSDNFDLFENMIIANSTSTDNATLQFDEESLNITFNADDKDESGSILFLMITFDYRYAPPPDFKFAIRYFETANETDYRTKVFLTTDKDNSLWNEWLKDPKKAFLYTEEATYKRATVDKRISFAKYAGLMNEDLFSWKYPNDPSKWMFLHTSETLFSQRANYSLYLEMTFKASASPSTCKIHLGQSSLKFFGDTWGLMGTDRVGHDVWAQLVYGVRISLLVGVVAAFISSALGILFGVSAGYSGGMTDTIIMRGVDILLCLPVLPILLILAAYYSFSVYYVILLIAIFGWQGLSRIVRSRVLSIKEMPFIESAKAAGATSGYIMTRHIIPNVLPVVMAAMVLSVPGAILTEAALSFLGFGDPNVPTWGRMLYRARTQGAFGALAWWYVLPPGLAITFLCLAFVFIGHALDEIVNPRLRRRR